MPILIADRFEEWLWRFDNWRTLINQHLIVHKSCPSVIVFIIYYIFVKPFLGLISLYHCYTYSLITQKLII